MNSSDDEDELLEIEDIRHEILYHMSVIIDDKMIKILKRTLNFNCSYDFEIYSEFPSESFKNAIFYEYGFHLHQYSSGNVKFYLSHYPYVENTTKKYQKKLVNSVIHWNDATRSILLIRKGLHKDLIPSLLAMLR